MSERILRWNATEDLYILTKEQEQSLADGTKLGLDVLQSVTAENYDHIRIALSNFTVRIVIYN